MCIRDRSDGGVLEQTTFFQRLKNNDLNLPENYENIDNMNFVFIGDEAFVLHDHFLKHFNQRET